jgi:hypothetical protein
MERSPLEDLLKPSLQHGHQLKPPYSVRAGFFVAFFGGILSAVGFAWLNSIRSQRIVRDAPWLAVLGLVGVALTIWIGYAAATQTIPGFISALDGDRQGVRLFGRAAGIFGFGITYLLQRDMHVTRDLRGQEAPSAWGPGIAVCIAGGVVQAVLALLGNSLGQP